MNIRAYWEDKYNREGCSLSGVDKVFDELLDEYETTVEYYESKLGSQDNELTISAFVGGTLFGLLVCALIAVAIST